MHTEQWARTSVPFEQGSKRGRRKTNTTGPERVVFKPPFRGPCQSRPLCRWFFTLSVKQKNAAIKKLLSRQRHSNLLIFSCRWNEDLSLLPPAVHQIL